MPTQTSSMRAILDTSIKTLVYKVIEAYGTATPDWDALLLEIKDQYEKECNNTPGMNAALISIWKKVEQN